MNINLTRQNLRNRRKNLSSQERARASLEISKNVLQSNLLSTSTAIGIYLQNDGEVDPEWIVKNYSVKKKSFYVPVINNDDSELLLFSKYEHKMQFKKNKYGIREPESPTLIDANFLDVVLMPLVGFDRTGNRIGMGGGFYDRTFKFLSGRKKIKPLLIGLAYSIQEVANIPNRPWDIPLNFIATENEIICAKQK